MSSRRRLKRLACHAAVLLMEQALSSWEIFDRFESDEDYAAFVEQCHELMAELYRRAGDDRLPPVKRKEQADA